MTPTLRTRLALFAVLAALMAATRMNHFGPMPDASWAVFFLGGAWLARDTRWAFPALMALAVGVDWWVITGQGIDFWNHYCVSAAYWFLVPAYAAMWAGGAWLRRRYAGARWDALGRLAFAFVLSVLACHLLAQGSFYWLSDSVTDPTLAGWWEGRDLSLRSQLGLFPNEAMREAQIVGRAQDRARLLLALERESLLPQGLAPDPVAVPAMTPAL